MTREIEKLKHKWALQDWDRDVAAFYRYMAIFETTNSQIIKEYTHRSMVRISAKYPSAKLKVPVYKY